MLKLENISVIILIKVTATFFTFGHAYYRILKMYRMYVRIICSIKIELKLCTSEKTNTYCIYVTCNVTIHSHIHCTGVGTVTYLSF